MSAASGPGTEALAAQAAGETGNAGTPGQAAYVTRNLALKGNPDDPNDHAQVAGLWNYWLSPEERAAEEAGAQAAVDAFLAGDSVSAGSIREALAAREPQAAPGDGALRGRIEDLALELEQSALATYPSKKSALEDGIATKLRAILEGK